MECRLKALAWHLAVGLTALLQLTYGFRYHRDFKRGFTGIETIVKRGVERLCDSQANEVITGALRPLVRIADGCEGDIHTKIAHTVSKLAQIPIETAAIRLRDELKKESDAVKDCFVTGNHYVNIVLHDGYIRNVLREMDSDQAVRLGVPYMSSGTVVVDYFSPNVGKDLHMGHLRSAAIGAALSNILEFCGSRVIRRNHVGDFGSQSGQIMRYLMEYDPTSIEAFTESQTDKERAKEFTRLIDGYSIWSIKGITTSGRFSRPTPGVSAELIINTMGEIYKNAKELCDTDPEFQLRSKEETALLQRGKHMYQECWKSIVKTSIASHRDILEQFKLDAIRDVPESCYAKRVFAFVDRLVKQGHALARPDGSIVIPWQALNEQSGDTPTEELHDLVLITKEGAATYLAVDITALEYRLSEHKPNEIIYITDLAQKPHFDKVIAIARHIGFLKDQKIEHLGFGAVLSEDGKKMRSRTKTGVNVHDIWKYTLKRCLDEVEKKGEFLGQASMCMAHKLAVGSMLYADLSTKHTDTYVFSTDRLLNQGGNNLISILYPYVRARSILRKIEQDAIKVVNEDLWLVGGKPFLNRSARQLALHILGLENAIFTTAYLKTPHRLCKYVRSLGRIFTHFYDNNRVIDQGKAEADLVHLVRLFSQATKLVLKLLNIETLEFL
ncbi:putative arginyl-tRNA synthetase [Babesia bovis T2Bo]|uniref:arginine--tRNA ligase n=1 Tax=Babesia bovis TaxID=5865 RepID=A7AWU2_BABBO|nr:putative arginyl-tRNA synthetase [Babesia bovis T2Bo]EDO05520.1 putative arginyl-tRNA synthetase [Babesia bovis T2Bo]|eukprot:XP_001609088.1 arginyl-tRNA synthetase [Babesia bovis T2Bo]